jgi:feruloyl esterase
MLSFDMSLELEMPMTKFFPLRRNLRRDVLTCAVCVAACVFATPAWSAPCDGLAVLAFKDAKITSAQVVPAGQFSAPGGQQGAAARNPYKELPEFCRVAATLTPSSDSDIKIEVWLPTANWNGKFQAVGNGGWAGVISYSAMAEAVHAGYATASTDTGHTSAGGQFAFGHPEKLIDFAWRSEHEMTVKAKAIVEKFYGSGPRWSYWNGCSTGGRQALKEAQMFPNDFDGIIAGDPANRTALAMWIAHAVKDPASYIPPEKYRIIHQAALDTCDAEDGVKDGLISEPTRCAFDPGVLLCKGADAPTCLTAPQLKAAKTIYAPAVNPRTGKLLSPPLVPGTELGWGDDASQKPNANILDQYRYVVFKDPDWDWKTFDFDRDATRGDLPENLVMNATDPNLQPFFAHGGKLLLYQGWSDPRVPALQTINYYQSVVDRTGGSAKASNNIRLFVAPGMGHCGGGDGPNVFEKVGPLEQWVEHGKAPDQIVASHASAGKVDRTRPLCAYPQVAKYKGTGSIDDSANFLCVAK